MYTKEQVCEMGERIYTEKLREVVETLENIGKMIVIEIETGDYEIGGNSGLEAQDRLEIRHPQGIFYGVRVGYTVAETIGGVMPRRAA